MDWKLEVVVVPVTDVDRAKEFYADKLGFTLDVDHRAGENFRVVQLTPPGLGLLDRDRDRGRRRRAGLGARACNWWSPTSRPRTPSWSSRGVECSEISHFAEGGRTPGLDPERRDYGSFVFFSDPDGNSWAVQEGRRSEQPA